MRLTNAKLYVIVIVQKQELREITFGSFLCRGGGFVLLSTATYIEGRNLECQENQRNHVSIPAVLI